MTQITRRANGREVSNGREVLDESLMARYADGDVEAFDEFFHRYEPRAYGYFVKRTGSPESSQDLYQELFLRIDRARDRYDSSRPFTPWFFQIANRLLIDNRRRSFRNHEVPLEDREPRTARPGSEDGVVGRHTSIRPQLSAWRGCSPPRRARISV